MDDRDSSDPELQAERRDALGANERRVFADGWKPAEAQRIKREVRDLTSTALATEGGLARLELRFDELERRDLEGRKIAARKHLDAMEAIAVLSSGLRRNAESDAAAANFFKLHIERSRDELDALGAQVGAGAADVVEVRGKLATHDDIVARLAVENAGTKALAIAADEKAKRALTVRRWKIAGLGGTITALIPVLAKIVEHFFP